MEQYPTTSKVRWRLLGREWLRLGAIGFGGPPAHIALLRRLCVVDRQWMGAEEFEHAVATTGLLPGPASTQLAIYCAWRLRGWRGALLGGAAFIIPGLIMIVALSALFFTHSPGRILLGASLGAGAVVPAIAMGTAQQLLPSSWRQTISRPQRWRWTFYVIAGALVALFNAALVVLVLVACGIVEVLVRRAGPNVTRWQAGLLSAGHLATVGGLGGLILVAFKVGALSYGGGFVIIPLMQHDVVNTYHWMTGSQFLNAVALGQITPGPVVLTTAAVGYAAHGLLGAALATVVAFGPSFGFIIFGARHFEKLRRNAVATAFLAGAGPSVIGAIGGSAVTLGLLLNHEWQVALLAVAVAWISLARRHALWALLAGVVLGAALSGVVPV